MKNPPLSRLAWPESGREMGKIWMGTSLVIIHFDQGDPAPLPPPPPIICFHETAPAHLSLSKRQLNRRYTQAYNRRNGGKGKGVGSLCCRRNGEHWLQRKGVGSLFRPPHETVWGLVL